MKTIGLLVKTMVKCKQTPKNDKNKEVKTAKTEKKEKKDNSSENPAS